MKADDECITQIQFWAEHIIGMMRNVKGMKKNQGTANEMSLKSLRTISNKLRGRADELDRILDSAHRRINKVVADGLD